MKVNRFSHRQDGSGPIARERLKLMAESAPFEHSPAAARRMKKEISDIISRYPGKIISLLVRLTTRCNSDNYYE